MKQFHIFCFSNGNVYAVFQNASEAHKHLKNLREKGFEAKSKIRGIATFYTCEKTTTAN